MVHEWAVPCHMGLCRAKREEEDVDADADADAVGVVHWIWFGGKMWMQMRIAWLSGASEFGFVMSCGCGCRCGWQ